jgi:Sugar-transfer associated ATP-grasp
LYSLLHCYKHVPHHYLTHELYRRDCETDVRAFIPPPLLRRFIADINPFDAILKVEDKLIFAALMRKAGLAHVPVLAIITRSDGSIRNPQGHSLTYESLIASLQAGGIKRVFAKPTQGANGVGHFVCEVEEDGFGFDGRGRSLQDLLARMFGDGLFDNYILQPVIQQHEVLQRLNPASVNTIRIDTFVLNGEIHHDGAVLRIGGGKACVDNWAAGGYLAKIDLQTGVLSGRAKSKAKYGRLEIRAHPLTGVMIEGLHLPFWEETKRLVQRAMRTVEPLRYVGWDVALTPDGPVLIEGNHPSDVSMLQDGVRGLRDTPFGTEVLRNVGLPHSGIQG